MEKSKKGNSGLGDSMSSQNAKIGAIINDAVREAVKKAPGSAKASEMEDKSSDEKKRIHDLGKEVFEASIDWTKLEDWRDENGMPVKSFIDVYQAIGLVPPMREWKAKTGLPIIPQMQIGCPFGTYNQLKGLIQSNWENWPIELVGNDKVEWKDGWEHKPRNHSHSVKVYVRNSIKYDADQVGPFINDEKTLSTDDNKVWFYERGMTEEEEKGLGQQ